MFSLFTHRAGPALLISLGFLLVAVGGYKWVESDREYDRTLNNNAERMFTQALINDYGSRAALRIGEDMTTSERDAHRARFKAMIEQDREHPAHATRRGAKRMSVLQLVIGSVLLIIAGTVYSRTIAKKMSPQ